MAKYQRRLGDIRIHRIVELTEAELAPRIIFPETGPEDWDRHQAWMPPRAMDPSSGNLIVVFQAFLLQTSHHNILVDACVGDNKPREDNPNWHLQQRGTFLPLLAQAGVTPEAVNYVMCTHMHSDHVGWNTELRDGRWVPTFPNAEYIFSRKELAAWEALHKATPQPHMTDSVFPILEAGQARLVDNDFAIDDEVWFESTPGHTPDHVSVRMASRGARGTVTGDLIHSPVQCLEPSWLMFADFEPERAKTTRHAFLDAHCDTDILVCATHFPEPSFGHIVRRDDAFWFEYEEWPHGA